MNDPTEVSSLPLPSPVTQPCPQIAFQGLSLLSETISHVSVDKYFERRLQRFLKRPLHVSLVYSVQ